MRHHEYVINFAQSNNERVVESHVKKLKSVVGIHSNNNIIKITLGHQICHEKQPFCSIRKSQVSEETDRNMLCNEYRIRLPCTSIEFFFFQKKKINGKTNASKLHICLASAMCILWSVWRLEPLVVGKNITSIIHNTLFIAQ